MNLNDKINRTLKVGSGCYYMNFSTFYEYTNKLFLSLAYTNCDFIYNKKLFLTFENPKESSEYISNENELIIAGTIDSLYIKDVHRFLKDTSDIIYRVSTTTICSNKDVDLKEIQSVFLSRNIPVMFTCDHYYMYSDYIKVTNDILHFHTNGHKAILFNIDFDNGTALIVDKFYSFIGTVKLSSLIDSIKSDYIQNGTFEILDNYNKLYSDNNTFSDVFLRNIKNLNNDRYITSDGSTYYKNIKALKMFREDFESIIVSLQDTKGKYAPQFLTKLIAPTLLQRLSFNNVIKFYENFFIQPNELLRLIGESSKLWRRIDTYNDKTYLTNKTLKGNIQKYLDLLDNLISIDTLLYQELNKIKLVEFS